MKAVLINPYELGRQPFGIAHPAAQLREQGHEVTCIDLAHTRLSAQALAGAELVAIHLAMHTATRIAAEAMPRIRAMAPAAVIATYGLYSPINAHWLHERGVTACLGGEFEPALLALATRIADGETIAAYTDSSVGKTDFSVPDRHDMPPLAEHARLRMPDGRELTMGFADASRGCKHLCRHCPVVPVYQGRFRIVPVEVVLADVRQQVAAGAEHISFGDPDFLNGPTHALRVARAIHAAFPELTFDAVIKVEHLLHARDTLAELRSLGLRMIISAVESVDDEVLRKLEKGHTRADFEAVVAMTRELDIDLSPTFLAFTPWTSLEGYVELLRTLVDLDLFTRVPPIQLAIRLLIPGSSRLLELPEMQALAGEFSSDVLGHPWRHPDPRVDALQAVVERIASDEDADRAQQFEAIWCAAHAALGRPAPVLPATGAALPPHHTENWYCCAEPTAEHLASF